jgi:hypothetical protein
MLNDLPTASAAATRDCGAITDHDIHLVRGSLEHDVRCSTSAPVALEARSANRNKLQERRASRLVMLGAALLEGGPAHNNNDRTLRRNVIGSDLALSDPNSDACRSDNEKRSRIGDRTVACRGQLVPGGWNRQANSVRGDDPLRGRGRRDRGARQRRESECQRRMRRRSSEQRRTPASVLRSGFRRALGSRRRSRRRSHIGQVSETAL